MSEEEEQLVHRHFADGESTITRRSIGYYKLTQYLRKYPPTEESFTLLGLTKRFDLPIDVVRWSVNSYRDDSKRFLKDLAVPDDLEEPSESFEWAKEQLHKDGFYFIQPLSYHRGEWGEPTFRQFEDYNTLCLAEGWQRVSNRLVDAIDYQLEVDGLDPRILLEDSRRFKRLLLPGGEDEEEESEEEEKYTPDEENILKDMKDNGDD